MATLKSFVASVICSLFLLGCHENKNESYYLTHPLVTLKKHKQCQITQVAYCKKVERAYRILSPFVAMAEEQPQRLGLTIMEAQQDLVRAQGYYAVENRKKKHLKSFQQAQLRVDMLLDMVHAIEF